MDWMIEEWITAQSYPPIKPSLVRSTSPIHCLIGYMHIDEMFGWLMRVNLEVIVHDHALRFNFFSSSLKLEKPGIRTAIPLILAIARSIHVIKPIEAPTEDSAHDSSIGTHRTQYLCVVTPTTSASSTSVDRALGGGLQL